jgi:multisubunit Na+/H+ antiporter MnhB subunit
VIARTSPIVSLAVRAVTPIALLIAAYVLFAGHNQPGGGFAAGLMLGAIIVLRTVAGIQQPRHAAVWMSVGGVIAGLVAIAPILWGEPLLDQVVVTWDVPVLGTVKTGSALAFDLGVVAIVVGLIIAVLDGFDATSLVDRGRTPAVAASTTTERSSNDDQSAAPPGVAS